MNKVYEQAKDLHVRNFIVYGKAADHKLYQEDAYTNKVSQGTMQDAFNKGALLIMVGAAAYAPVYMAGNIVCTVAKTGEPSAEFDATSTYAVGDLVVHSGAAYKCKTTISVAAAWDETKWDEIATVDFVEWESEAPTE